MNDTNGFYVTVASNASMHVYPNNKICNFRTKLAKPLLLNSAYEVGLIEVQYPRNWLSFTDKDSNIAIFGSDAKKKKYVIRPTLGFYNDIHKLVKEINSQLANVKDLSSIKLMYNDITSKIYVLRADGLNFIFRGRLAEILGFEPDATFRVEETPTKAPHPADIFGGSYNMFIYSDIVDYQLVGDSRAQLLRCINICNDTRSIPTLTYDKPHYAPICKTTLDDIEISLKNDQNELIPFLYGKVILKLHFKPIKNYF